MHGFSRNDDLLLQSCNERHMDFTCMFGKQRVSCTQVFKSYFEYQAFSIMLTVGNCFLKILVTRVRLAVIIGDLGSFFIVVTKSPFFFSCLSHGNRFFRLNSPGILESSLRENVF